jgi:hypothetical protein
MTLTRWVVGDARIASRFDFGTLNWTNYVVSATGSFDLLAVWGASLNDIWTVGTAGAIARFNGANWSQITSGTTESLNAIWGGAPNDIWIVGNNGTALHWDGVSLQNRPANRAEHLYGIWGDTSGKYWAVSTAGNILEYY